MRHNRDVKQKMHDNLTLSRNYQLSELTVRHQSKNRKCRNTCPAC